MIVLHAALLDRQFLLWGEAAGSAKKRASHLHPFDAGARAIKRGLAESGITVRSAISAATLAWLPSAEGAPVASHPLIAEPREPTTLASFTVSTLELSEADLQKLLGTCFERSMLAPGVIVGKDLAYWAIAMRFGAALVARQHFLPVAKEDEQGFYASWEPALVGAEFERFATLASAMPDACRALTAEAGVPEVPREAVLRSFLDDLVDRLVRPQGQRRGRSPRGQHLHDQWLHALTSPDNDLPGDPQELKRFVSTVAQWRRPLDAQAPYRLCLRLDEPEEGKAWPVRYWVQARHDPSLLVSSRDAWELKGQRAALLSRGGIAPREFLLSALGQASAICPEVDASLKTAIPEGYDLADAEAYRFLHQRAPALEEAGFRLLLPAWWTGHGTKQRLTAKAHVKSPAMQSKAGLGLDAIVDFDYQLALGDEALSIQELKALAKLKTPLVRIRGQWVEVDAQAIQSALDFWKKKEAQPMSARQAIRLALGAEKLQSGLSVEDLTATGWFADLLGQLDGKTAFEVLEPPTGFAGQLRPYQQRGYSWLDFLTRWGLGACLADDMGLGKTIQLLTLLQRDRERGIDRPVLLVAPMSVVGNWQREAARFTPDLPVSIHHGARRIKGEAFMDRVKDQALVITSYALLTRDVELLADVSWRGVVLDEAQNIKNPESKQSKAARAIPADYRIALTGTPVENHVGDLWSLMEFLNPGFMGSQASFKREFHTPLQVLGDPEAALRLKRITAPFILRRLKTDKAIISDLPDKQEMSVYCPLTKEQASLYAAVLEDMTEAMSAAKGIQRKGLILATLSKLKQVCNHPAQFLGDRSAIPGRSGKLARLTEMLEECRAVGDRSLVFTQFAEMGEILQRQLQETFGEEVFFLHGGVSQPHRDRMVERFQKDANAPGIFLLSLKAGGTGLTLTRANHVFHYDRWWNPAVENQATDRAFRIGQSRNVQVHKFLCLGTLEERIDQMIERKKQLAEQVVGSGEDWLTELSTSELKDLFALRKEAIEV